MTGRLYTFIARWDTRAEDARSCGERLTVMLRDLAKAHPAFARWNEQAYRSEDAYRSFCTMPPQIDELAARFACRAQEPVMGRDIGYSVGAWNGREDAYGANFHAMVGDGNEHAWNPAYLPNSVSIKLPCRSDETADLINASGMRAILLAVVAGWEPDCAEVKDVKSLDLPPGKHLPRFRAGWLSYIGPRYAKYVMPPPEAIAEAVPGGGLLLLATRELFDLSDPAHAAAAAAIQRALAPIQSVVGQER